MKVLPVLLFAIAACGDDGGNSGNVDAPPNDDLDFDGVPNDMDNCPISANGFQLNEDGDRFGDACDPCPPIANDNPPDGDMDGVADACDPKPAMFGDTVKFFEGFKQGKPSGWQEVGTWAASMDALTANLTGAGTFALIVTDRTRETITAEITVVSTVGAMSEVGLVDNLMQNGTPAVACALTGAPAVSIYETTNPGGGMTNSYELTTGATYHLTLTREDNAYSCVARNLGTMTVASATMTSTLSNAPYLSGLTLNAASIRVKWFMVVESL
jgi:hypothetical protein